MTTSTCNPNRSKQTGLSNPLKVWWIPQVPMTTPFEVQVDTMEEAALLIRVLAEYDKFKFERRIKPDYANTGGVMELVDGDDEGESGWYDWYDDLTGNDFDTWLEQRGTSHEYEI
jgi:hypothetical protein